MSEQIVQVADASPSTKNMRTIQQTANSQTVQSEVIVLATGAANAGDTYDARQIRALTSADIVTAVLQGVTLDGMNLQTLRVDRNSNLNVNVQQTPLVQIPKMAWGSAWNSHWNGQLGW
jgi:hypothetical protein